MIRLFKEELLELSHFLRRNSSEITLISSATLFLALNQYNRIGSEWISEFLYFAVLPILVIIFILRKNPLDFGLRPGNIRIWGFWVVVMCLISAAVLYASSFIPSLQVYYHTEKFNMLNYFLTNCVLLAAWEFIFRGFLLFGLRKKFGEASIVLQMVPFVLMHLGKPELETISTIITGILFGYIVYRGNSFWPAFIIHLFINVFFLFLVNC